MQYRETWIWYAICDQNIWLALQQQDPLLLFKNYKPIGNTTQKWEHY